MIDGLNIGDRLGYTQAFYASGSGHWQVWNKPNNCKMVSIFCLAGGGGGGGGQVFVSGNISFPGDGGGGGGAGGYSTGVFSASDLPATLYLQIGNGGSGSATNGANGTDSYVSVRPNITTINLLLAASGGGGGSGGGGDEIIPGTGGPIWTSGILNEIGLVTGSAGPNGDLSSLSNIVTGGAHGGAYFSGSPLAGASITGSGQIPTIPSGGNGYTSLNINVNSSNRVPMFFTGGGGGNASNSGGRFGGNGSYGSGGGGGGASTGTPGNGGNGGNGLIIITCY